ncbi:DUF2147 domain-containing protein [Ruegeria sp. ANG10]|uniref:DUF2147 domain-containing protein n=1 Tax=Ruegeria sp. ANG10 TaxID=3042467 RepID=UPI0034564F3F
MRRLKRTFVIPVVIAVLMPVMAVADPIVGVWKTEPDRKNLISHIKISACGDKFCGQIQSAYDKTGKEVQTPNIGKKLFWDVASEGGGKYGGGDFWIPMVNVDVVPQITLSGDTLTVRGCEHVVCGHQKWTRLSN